MTHSYEDIPLAHSEFGARLYERGRRLVREDGARLSELVWDADEVLWDWLMDASLMLRAAPAALLERDLGHREFYLVKPGVFELIWGMRHESLERGLDAHMRIWTNGYPWRLWRVACEIPGFHQLVGPPAAADDVDHHAYLNHPRIFYRTDYARVAEKLLEPRARPGLLSHAPSKVRRLVSRQLERNPFDSSFKLPEFAQVCGKDGFGCSKILVDDTHHNIRRFVASGRHGVHVVNHAPRIIFGKVPNTVWLWPRRALESLANEIAVEIADALSGLVGRDEPGHVAVESDALARGHVPLRFEFDVPDAMIRSEWIDPIRKLKALGR